MEQHEDEISLKEIVLKAKELRLFLWNKKGTLVFLTVVCATIGFLYALNAKTTYKAQLTFALAESDGSGGSLGAVASQFGFDLGGGTSGAFSGDNILELMKSRTLFEKTVMSPLDSTEGSRLLIAEYIKTHLDSTSKKKDLAPNVEFKQNNTTLNYWQDSFISVMHKNLIEKGLSINKIDKKLSIIKVEVTDTDPLFAKIFAERLVENVTSYYLEVKNKQSLKTIRQLEHKTDSVRAELGRSMVGLAKQTDNNQLLIRNTPRVNQGKQQLQVQLLTTLYGELVKNLEMTRTLYSKDQPLIQIIDTPKYPLEKTRFSKLKGVVLGSVLGFFLGVFWLLGSRFYKQLLD